ncbi:MAG TPA: hypothetical protein VNR59_08075 [Gaiellaceae bacterium]|nr:hypothetical protein [Gaiellaceae bacterium]
MRGLDGTWNVERTGGFLPPLFGVRKHVAGDRGDTRLGALPGVPFRVVGNELRYRRPFAGFVDVVEPDARGFSGRATFRGRTFGRFVLRRPAS